MQHTPVNLKKNTKLNNRSPELKLRQLTHEGPKLFSCLRRQRQPIFYGKKITKITTKI